MTTASLDPRTAAFRPDLADVRLRGRVEAQRFVGARPMRVAAALAPFRGRPDAAAPLTATKLMGEPLDVFEVSGGWAWAQSALDGYVGYVPASALVDGHAPEAAHEHALVSVLRAPLQPEPSLKAPSIGWAPLAGALALEPAVETAGYRRLLDGRWISARHVRAPDGAPADWVAVAETLVGLPYVWGGDSADGLDCSGLVALARRAVGRPCARDSDQQERTLGAPAPLEGPRTRGDLVFWPGHVGVMLDRERLLHANAWAMVAAVEPLATATARIAERSGERPRAVRRLPSTA